MCNFDYQRFDECGHKVIKLSEPCQARLWAAGINGMLLACRETWYTTIVVDHSSEFNARWRWHGMKGWCLSCEREFLCHTTPFPMRSYNDEIFQYFSTLAQGWEEPFIHLPAIHKSVPELLGLARQYRLVNEWPREEGPELRFKEKFQVYDREAPQNRMQWLRGDPSIDQGPQPIQRKLRDDYGFTEFDFTNIGKAIEAKCRGSVIYEREFEKRGMPRRVFDHMAGKVLAQHQRLLFQQGKKFVDYWNA